MTAASKERCCSRSLHRLREASRALHRHECGSALVEFSLSVSLLLMVMFGIIGFSLEVFAQHFLAGAARSAARYAMVRGSTAGVACGSVSAQNCTATSSNVTSYVQSLAPGSITLSSLQVTTSWPGTTPTGSSCANAAGNNSPGCLVSVTVRYAFAFQLPFLGNNTANITSTGAQAIVQ